MIYLQLLYSYLKIGFFGFGGGYAMLSLIQHEVVVKHGWLTEYEFADIIAVSQIAPGPIAVNSATYIGYSVTGNVWGAVVATISVCLPALTVMLLLARFYLKVSNNRYVYGAVAGIQPMVIGMIAAAALLLMTPATFIDWTSWVIFGACLLGVYLKINPILLIILSGLAGYLIYAGPSIG